METPEELTAEYLWAAVRAGKSDDTISLEKGRTIGHAFVNALRVRLGIPSAQLKEWDIPKDAFKDAKIRPETGRIPSRPDIHRRLAQHAWRGHTDVRRM